MHHRSTSDRVRAVLAVGAAAALAASAAGAAHAADAPSTTRTVSYLGHDFRVPTGWEVVDLAADPTACVRFDRHAVYLGSPGTDQNCPAHLAGRTEALLIEPRPDGGTDSRTADNQAAGELDATAPRIKVTATYAGDRDLVKAILRDGGLADAQPTAATTGATTGGSAPRAMTATTAAYVPGSVTDYTGYGFDACSAPTSAQMSAWMGGDSPYRAIGVYIGGARACAQPNLTSAWVQQQANAGWRFIPTYIGTQASGLTDPSTQGALSADDAVAQATALGFGPGSTLYDDMEAYPVTPATSNSVLAYLAAWTNELHVRGYHSGVYSSSSSGITDLVKNYNNYAMPDVIWDAKWNGVATTDDTAVPAGLWANHQRIHQYSGNVTETHGGVTINIDQDYLDVAVSANPIVANSRIVSVAENNTLHDVYPAADGWHDDPVPGVGTGVTAVSMAYYQGSRTEAVIENGTLHDVYPVADGWRDNLIPTTGGTVTAVAMAYSPSGLRAIEAVEGNTLHELYRDAAGWHDGVIPTTGTSVTAVAITYKSNGDRVIEAVEDGVLHEIYADSTGWHDNAIAGTAGGATAVSFAINSSGGRVIEAVEGGYLHEIYSDSTGWHDSAIPGVGATSAVSMSLRSDGTRVLEAAEQNTLHEIYTAWDGWHDNLIPGVGTGITSTALAYH